jgi:hypothetical protein
MRPADLTIVATTRERSSRPIAKPGAIVIDDSFQRRPETSSPSAPISCAGRQPDQVPSPISSIARNVPT